MDDEEMADIATKESPQMQPRSPFLAGRQQPAIPANTLIPGKVMVQLARDYRMGGVTQADGNYTQFVIVEPRPLTTTILGGSKRTLYREQHTKCIHF